jgi:3-hydroxyisobutyrate dehydrogenase
VTLRAGFIGLGNIGKPLASHLAPTGFETTIYDIADEPVRELEKAGAKAASSPRELAENADVIGICVPEDRHVRDVMTGEDGILAGASPGTVVAIHSTVLPATVQELAREAAPRGVSLLDACVTGGEQRAAEGVVTYLVGGDASVLAKARPFLDASSESVIHAGELGNGAKLKLCINVVTYIQWAAAYEGCKLAMATVKLPGEARASEAYQRVVRGHMHTAEKDLAWALQMARESGLTLPVSGLVSQTMARLYGVEDDQRR